MDALSGARFLLRNLNWLGLWQHSATAVGPAPPTIRILLQRLPHLPFTFLLTALMLIEMLRSASLEQASDVVYMSLTETALVIKVLSIWQTRDHIQVYVDAIGGEAQLQPHSPSQRAYWAREQRTFRRFAVGYLGLSFCVVSCSNVGVLFSSAYVLPFAYWVPFEWRREPAYWYAYGFNCLAMYWTSMSNATLDMSFCYFLRHLSLLYKLIGQRLAGLQRLDEADVKRELRRIFRLHQKVRRLTEVCEVIISTPILSQIVLSALVLCFSGYRLQQMNIAGNLIQFLAMLQYLAVMISQIFLPCYYANEVVVNSNQLSTDMYTAHWHEYSMATRKLVFAYMEFLKRPAKIKAGGYFEVGLPIFTKTMNNAYSFFALLLNMAK